jgi:arsenate reductase
MNDRSEITIYHNPACQTSRNALAAIRQAGHTPRVVDYLKTGWTLTQLKGLLTAMGKSPRDVLRVRGTPAESLGLIQPGVGDDALLEAMIAHPILVERPIVVTPKGTVLARPVEKLSAVL